MFIDSFKSISLKNKVFLYFIFATFIIYLIILVYICLSVYKDNYFFSKKTLALENKVVSITTEKAVDSFFNSLNYSSDFKIAFYNYDISFLHTKTKSIISNQNSMNNDLHIDGIFLLNRDYKIILNESYLEENIDFKKVINDKTSIIYNNHILFSSPIQENNYTHGYIISAISLSNFNNYISLLDKGFNSNIYISDNSGNILYKKECLSRDNINYFFDATNKNSSLENFYKTKDCFKKPISVYEVKSTELPVVFFTTIKNSNFFGIEKIISIIAALTIGYFSVMLIFIFTISFVSKKLNKTILAIEEIAMGNTTTSFDKLESFPRIKNAISKIIRNINYISDETLRVSNFISKGDLGSRLHESNTYGNYFNILYNINNSITTIHDYLDFIEIPIITLNENYNIIYANKTAKSLKVINNGLIKHKNFFSLLQISKDLEKEELIKQFLSSSFKYSSKVIFNHESFTIEMDYSASTLKDSKGNISSYLIYITDYKETKAKQILNNSYFNSKFASKGMLLDLDNYSNEAFKNKNSVRFKHYLNK